MTDFDLREEYSDKTPLIRLYKGDEKKYEFPTRGNWRYQLLVEVSFKNRQTGKKFHFGRSVGADAGADYCPSKARQVFNYKRSYDEAIDKGLKRCAGDNEYGSDSRKYGMNQIGAWKVDKVYAVYLLIWKDLTKTKSGKKRPIKPVVLKEKSKKNKLSEAELEKKYPTPKKYLNAQRALARKIKAQNVRKLKREKAHRVALKRKK